MPWDNLVIVGSPERDQRIDLVAADPPLQGQTNVVYSYSVHFYAGTHGQWLRARKRS
jgi:endoglucanase